MNLTLDDDERLWCVLNRNGKLLVPPTKDHHECYETWVEHDAESRIFMLKPVGFSPRK